jgi:hypothetical protein
MDPAPGFDPDVPHDLLHFVVEEQLGLTDGIFGRIAAGGTARTFHPIGTDGDKRERRRAARNLARRDDRLASQRVNDFGQSEHATIVCFHDWLAHSGNPLRRARAATIRDQAIASLDRMTAAERAALDDNTLTRVRSRLDEVSASWSALARGESFSVHWRLRAHADRTSR